MTNQLLRDRSPNGHSALGYTNGSCGQPPNAHHSLSTGQLSGQLAAVSNHAGALGLSLAAQSGSLFPQLGSGALLNSAAIAAVNAAAVAAVSAAAGSTVKQIASSSVRLIDFIAFLDLGNGSQSSIDHVLDPLLDNRHVFVQIGGRSLLTDPLRSSAVGPFENIDLRQISDKFPQNKNGLKELYDRGPLDAFYLVKCWVRLSPFSSTHEVSDCGFFI